jgi:uncharacterized protein (TIGR02594 family)
LNVTALWLAQRFIGVAETPGGESNPRVLAMLKSIASWPKGDEVAWCSAFAHEVAWLLDLPRSKSLGARTWLRVGRPVPLSEAQPGFDVVIFKRGDGPQPGPEVIEAAGHVAFYVRTIGDASQDGAYVEVVGGNQGDAVSTARYRASSVLGIRRLA